MVNPIPLKFKKFWDAWNIRGVMLFSLSMQTFLILFAPLRKGTANKLIIMLLWSVYLLADWAANFAVGIISDSQGNPPDASTPSENSDLLAFWPPFLLLHLGGPDTITAFALEDNELWLRHLLGLIFQAVAAVYVFLQSLPGNKLAIPTILMFVSGTIKYLERTRALYLASLDRFRDSMLKEPDPGPNYAKLMDEYASKEKAKHPAKIIIIEEPVNSYVKSEASGVRDLNNLEVVQQAHRYFEIFKGLIVDLIFSFHERDESMDFFGKLRQEDALRVIEVELNFIYEVFYTKIQVVHSVTGHISRFVSFSLVVVAFSLFHFKVKKNNFDHFDVKITYALFWGAIGLDTVAFFMLVFSDWTFAALRISSNESKLLRTIKSSVASVLSWFLIFKKPRWYQCQNQEVLATPFLFRRWCGYVSGYNLVRYCLKGRPTRIHQVHNCFQRPIKETVHYLKIEKCIENVGLAMAKISQFLCIREVIHVLGFIGAKFIEISGLTDFVDEIRYVSQEPLTKKLWEFIFDELMKKSAELDRSSSKPKAAKKISSAIDDRILRNKLSHDITEVAYDESLLLWHIATELLYHHEDDQQHISGDDSNYREFSKVLSDYMLYLLVFQPSMMSAVAGIGKIRFRDTCAEANRLFKRKGLRGNQEKEACTKILKVDTYVKPVTVKGDRSKSVLFDASILAKELINLDDKWELLSKKWVDLLSYAACNCSARTHAQQVSKGGELITFVWLLMAHFGLGDQFQINKGQGRAKLIVTK
ncbi:hypothetical protein Ddye_028264 [Dipteronia dyeriana]|uniref:DUF4220 domain-containing protein n=1 Tax=Dipteronia dyeriana TaxID=168575 RepID=A0AAD9WR03_9ROSI|nr:hypothetical protein Ddye_028264 [Dipteronia dyeriana]